MHDPMIKRTLRVKIDPPWVAAQPPLVTGELILGIDLGTTNSAVGAVESGSRG